MSFLHLDFNACLNTAFVAFRFPSTRGVWAAGGSCLLTTVSRDKNENVDSISVNDDAVNSM